LKNKVTRRKYWVHDRFNQSGEVGSFGAARATDMDMEDLDHFIQEYMGRVLLKFTLS
jgi:hypothetical protein